MQPFSVLTWRWAAPPANGAEGAPELSETHDICRDQGSHFSREHQVQPPLFEGLHMGMHSRAQQRLEPGRRSLQGLVLDPLLQVVLGPWATLGEGGGWHQGGSAPGGRPWGSLSEHHLPPRFRAQALATAAWF